MSELDRAFLEWRLRHYTKHVEADELVVNFLRAPSVRGWLKMAREALQLSTREVAKEMGVCQSRYCQLEKVEKTGNLMMESLLRAAEAMNCEFVYALRPKSQMMFSEVIWHTVLPNVRECRKPGALAYFAREMMVDPRFRAAKGWSTNKEPVRYLIRLIYAADGRFNSGNVVKRDSF